MLISYLPWVSQRQRRLLHPRLNSFRRYAALWRAPRAVGGGCLAASSSHDVRLQAITIVSRSTRMTQRRDAAATSSRPSGECRPQGGCNDGVPPAASEVPTGVPPSNTYNASERPCISFATIYFILEQEPTRCGTPDHCVVQWKTRIHCLLPTCRIC